MATSAQGRLFCLIEDASEFNLTVETLHRVTFSKPKGTHRVTQIERWVCDPARLGYFDATWTLAPYHGADDPVDSFDFVFTDANTAMEFKLRFV